MDAKLLRDLAKRYQENHEFITNEEMTKQSLIVPFIAGLGYDPSNPREVRLEYTAEFTANDGKRSPDRMDYAIFGPAAQVPILVIEAKPLGSDVRARSPQLARYMSQLPLLRFGIITDGCEYLFFSDLSQPNVMDASPFFSFSLADPKLDFDSVAMFLCNFSKEQFKTDKLVADAEDSNYRQQMIEKLVKTLRAPESDEDFVKWLSDGIYQGLRRQAVLERLGRIARESIQPAILRTIGDDFLAQLRTRINEAAKPSEPAVQEPAASPVITDEEEIPAGEDSPESLPSRSIVTTEEELEFYRKVRDICTKAGEDPENVVYRDTLNYFNVIYASSSRWFLRYFSGRRKAISTQIPVDELATLASEFKVEPAPQAFGVSRVIVDSVDQVWALANVVLRALELCKQQKPSNDE